jgi:DNA-3-methyladenine glycosylase II
MTTRERHFLIEPSAPFRLDLTAWALRRRPHNEIDRWDGRAYRRALPLGNGAMALSVAEEGDARRLAVAITGDSIDGNCEARARVALDRLLGLEVDLSGFAKMAAADPTLAGLATRMRGLRPPRFPTVFEALVNGIACQQLSLIVGVHLLNRLTAAYGLPAEAGPEELHAFPGPAELAGVDPVEVQSLGFSLAKARTIITSARAILDRDLDLESLDGAEDGAVLERLMRLHGVGRWTAQYVMLRGLGRLHIFPGDDVGARNKLENFLGLDRELDYEGVKNVVSRWAPYGGLVYFHLLLDSLSEAGALSDHTHVDLG